MTHTSEFEDVSDWPWVCPHRGNKSIPAPMNEDDFQHIRSFLRGDPATMFKTKCESCGQEQYRDINEINLTFLKRIGLNLDGSKIQG